MSQNHSLIGPMSSDLESTMTPEDFPGGMAVTSAILGLSFLVGAPGNIWVIWTILKHVKQRSHTVTLILQLAAADLLVLITLPIWIYSLTHSWVFGEASCKVMVYVINSCMYGSIFFITLMSIERCAAVRHPFASAECRRKKVMNKVILVLWPAAFLFSVPVLLTQVVGDPGDEQCLYRDYTSVTQEAVCVLMETMVGFVVPFCILVVCYSCLCTRIAPMKLKSKRKTTGLIAGMVVVFATCWIPYHVGNVLSLIILVMKEFQHDVAKYLEDFRTTTNMVAGALVFISSSVNPLLYLFAARSFRRSQRETGIQKLFRHISSTSQGTQTKELSFVTKRQTQSLSSQCVSESKEQIDV